MHWIGLGVLEILDQNHQTQEPGEWHGPEVCIASERFRFEQKKAQVGGGVVKFCR